MTKILICECGYATLQERNDPKAISIGDLRKIHESAFPEHKIEMRDATGDEIIKYAPKQR